MMRSKNKFKVKGILVMGLVFLCLACTSLQDQANEKLKILNQKADKLDSLVNREIEKVEKLDSMLEKELNKVQSLDSLLFKNPKIDSLMNKAKSIYKN